jgi:hypothetical protein
MLEKRSRVSEQMMNVQDWLPTLYAAAGIFAYILPVAGTQTIEGDILIMGSGFIFCQVSFFMNVFMVPPITEVKQS